MSTRVRVRCGFRLWEVACLLVSSMAQGSLCRDVAMILVILAIYGADDAALLVNHINKLPLCADAARQLRLCMRGQGQTLRQAIIPTKIKATSANLLGAFQTPPQAVVSGNQGQSRRDRRTYLCGCGTGAGYRDRPV